MKSNGPYGEGTKTQDEAMKPYWDNGVVRRLSAVPLPLGVV